MATFIQVCSLVANKISKNILSIMFISQGSLLTITSFREDYPHDLFLYFGLLFILAPFISKAVLLIKSYLQNILGPRIDQSEIDIYDELTMQSNLRISNMLRNYHPQFRQEEIEQEVANQMRLQ